jgi:hypothetical protein
MNFLSEGVHTIVHVLLCFGSALLSEVGGVDQLSHDSLAEPS